ncbi:AzlC family ABC transporter permease [Pseudorhodobacter sp.]|uniref:AzlC family ABC transporter permease n=1 Tax=Pseudorhodobacter sp. TaxID=1934400 RepID=UPI002649FB72|nr:AzlC family ABC transporter permease [Pseudorhodobacter sp.]MDN5785659.1 AzlC family ABC transporter permease [Pseudorhodobacter sp.]
MHETERQSLRASYWRGLRDCSPFILIIIPFSTVFGVVARDAGLDLLQVVSMSVIVIAGSAQFTALSLLQEGAPVFVVLIASLAVNMRMAMYSAALVPYLGKAPLGMRMLMAYVMVDQTFAVSVRTFDSEPEMPLRQRIAYYFGSVTVVCLPWYLCTFLGALLGQAIPASLSADFAVPACFIALFAPMLRTLPHIVTAGVSVAAAIVFSSLPWNLGLIVAALLAMAAGAQTEFWQRRRIARMGTA